VGRFLTIVLAVSAVSAAAIAGVVVWSNRASEAADRSPLSTRPLALAEARAAALSYFGKQGRSTSTPSFCDRTTRQSATCSVALPPHDCEVLAVSRQWNGRILALPSTGYCIPART
jgi:hypothetical protein